MISGQTGYKARILAALIVVCALWATVAIAGVNEDFFEAAKRGDLPAVKRFIANGINVNAKANDGTTALMYALMYASREGHKQIVQLLLDKGADVNAKGNEGQTALMYASSSSYTPKEVVELVLVKGADVNAEDNYGWTALILASDKGNFDVIPLLLSKGADVNAKTKSGFTAMTWASGNVKELLVKAGAK